MTLLEKIDAVFDWLYIHSGENPNFPDIEEGLKNYEIDKGEIRDILLKLKKEGLIYTEGGGNLNAEYSDHSHYLINFDGKYFKETIGSFTEKIRRENAAQQTITDQTERSERNEEQLVSWTQNLTNRTADLTYWTRLVALGAIGLVVWEIIQYFLERLTSGL